MKRLFLLVFALTLLLAGCSRQSREPHSFEKMVSDISSTYGEEKGFTRADRDFVETNFGTPSCVRESAVFLSDTGEIGIFYLSDAKYATDIKESIEAYLAIEREAVVSLAELYPADELSARLARFDSARVDAVGNIVYYYMLDAKEADAVQKLFGN